MYNETLSETVERIKYMETCFDVLCAAVKKDAGAACEKVWFKGLLQILLSYYEGGRWLEDYKMDEAGYIPQNLKRGVLSEDGVYNFLEEISSSAEK